jgi:hypothetical protein
MQQANNHPQPEEEHYGRHIFHRQRLGAGRVIAYFLIMIVLNALLAVYALYMLGIALAFDWTILRSGSLQVILESALQLLLFFSPVILTILLNRLLYRVFRGHGRFPRGTWFFALLAIIVVQSAMAYVITSYGYVDGSNGFKIEPIAARPVG